MDGTKIEANTSLYSFVWETAVSKCQAKLGKRIDKVPLEERIKRLHVSIYFARQREVMEQKIPTA